jgi:hypothetical protein
MEGQVSDLRLSSDGSRLYAALGDRLGVIDAASGSTLASYAADGVESIVNVETPAP